MLFANLTRDSAFAYLSDGLASEIATTLARVPRLEVRSPGAVRSAQRGIEPDPRVVGRRLNVRYVVEGDFQRGGDRIRISVRLVGVSTGTQRWSESYTRPVADLLAVQEEIARAVSTEIAGQLLPQERSVLAERPTRNPEAYDHLLRGNFQLMRRTPSGVARALDEYGAAVRLDSAFVQAQARIGLGYALYNDWGWELAGLTPDSMLALGMQAADRALRLDSTSGDAWLVRGYLLALRDPRALEGAVPALERATALDPRNAEAWHQYGSWLTVLGRHEEAIAFCRRALALEPVRPITWLNMGNSFEIMGRDAEALQAYDSALALDPEYYSTYPQRVGVRLRRGDRTGARADAAAAARFTPPSEAYYRLAAQALSAATDGDTARARGYADQAMAMFAGRVMGPFAAQMIAMAYGSVGDADRALTALERAEPRGAVIWSVLQYPAMAPLRADPRYQRLQAASRPAGAR